MLLAPWVLGAQQARPGASVVWARTVTPEFARESVVFTRAYSACPDETGARLAVEHGRFPHAIKGDEPGIPDYFGAGAGITVLTAASGDGDDSPFHRSVRVPLAIRWPGRLAPRVVNDLLISHVDVLPTLLGLAGIAAPEGMQGRDLSVRLVRNGAALPDSVFAEGRMGTTAEWRMLLRGFDKLIWDSRDQVTGLFNLADDPEEGINLAGKRQHQLTQDSMWALAEQWMRHVGDGRDPSGLRLRR